MALMKITSYADPDIIVDMDVPVVLSAAGTNEVTVKTGASTVKLEWADATADATATEAMANEDLNAIIEAGVADPYAIPEISGFSVPGAYLQPDVVRPFTDAS